MPYKSPRPCSQPGCGKPATTGGKCDTHKQQQHHYSDIRRGNATDRGYGTEHKTRFRAQVLSRDGHQCQECGAPGNIADHYPHSRRELITLGLDPDCPDYGRTLCKPCHDSHTGKTQGWMAKPDPPPPF